jgi:uncharacterized protein (DUF4415 family)
MSDDDIDYTDIPPLNDNFFQNAKLYVPKSRAILLDPDVFTWFAGQGQEYHTLINTILRQYMKRHTSKSTKHQQLATSSW